MILRYELPKEAEQVISLTDNERIYYAVPVDIDDAGNFLEDSFFIVTNRRLFVVEKDSIKQEYDVSKCIDVKAEAKIGGGLLVINFDGVPKAHCSLFGETFIALCLHCQRNPYSGIRQRGRGSQYGIRENMSEMPPCDTGYEILSALLQRGRVLERLFENGGTV